MTQYSVVIPLKNEEENILDLIEELEPIMQSLNAPWELICINDGSTDNTQQILAKSAKEKNYLKVITFTKNFGQSSAFDAGFKAAEGEYVITLDGDRQNDPADIPKLVEAIKNCDMVCGRRVNRRDPLIKKITSFFANGVRSRVCQDGMHDTGCSLKIYRKKCLEQIKMYEGMHRFLPALFVIEQYRVSEVPVNHRPRTKGQTKYNFFNRSFNTISDLFAVYWMRKRQLRYKTQRNAT